MEVKENREKFGRVGVLMGGPSSEREISFKSGKAVFEALRQLGLDVKAIDITTSDREENCRLLRSAGIRTAFVALHGWFGEDGQVQELLQSLKIPYTGSAPDAHRQALDKTLARQVFLKQGLEVPRGLVVAKGEIPDAQGIEALGLPLVVKPANQGSSIGLSIADDRQALDRSLREAFGYDEKVLIEQYIKGRELTVGILGDRPLPVVEIIPKRRFFDFEAKYGQGMTEYIVPAGIGSGLASRAQQAALKAHRALGCSGCSRADFLLEAFTDRLFLLEVNTIPGFTSTSLLPKAAQSAGIDFAELCLQLLEAAYEKK